jgi:hypothetical protein
MTDWDRVWTRYRISAPTQQSEDRGHGPEWGVVATGALEARLDANLGQEERNFGANASDMAEDVCLSEDVLQPFRGRIGQSESKGD